MATSLPPVVKRTTCWWSIVPGEGGKVSGSEQTHGAINLFRFVDPGQKFSEERYDVDRWMNHGDPAAFTGNDYAPFRNAITGLIQNGLSPAASLLDPALALVIETPGKWTWRPDGERTDGFLLSSRTVQDPSSQRKLAVHLVSVRGAIEARTRLMDKLNVTSITLMVNKGLPAQTEKKLTINWKPVYEAGRRVIIEQLQNGTPLIAKPPSATDTGKTMNALISDRMIDASPTLKQLRDLKLVAINGRDGRPFKKAAGKTTMVDDRSEDLQHAYNHIRFMLYMEWRTLFELK